MGAGAWLGVCCGVTHPALAPFPLYSRCIYRDAVGWPSCATPGSRHVLVLWGGNGGNGGLGKCKGMGSSSRLPQSPRADVSIDPGLPTPLSLLKISRSLVCQRCWTRCQPRAINTRLLFPSEVFLLPSHRPGSLPGQAEHHQAEGKITARVPAGPVPAPGDTRRPSSPVLPWLPALLAEKKSNKQAAALAALRKSTGASGFGT